MFNGRKSMKIVLVVEGWVEGGVYVAGQLSGVWVLVCVSLSKRSPFSHLSPMYFFIWVSPSDSKYLVRGYDPILSLILIRKQTQFKFILENLHL